MTMDQQDYLKMTPDQKAFYDYHSDQARNSHCISSTGSVRLPLSVARQMLTVCDIALDNRDLLEGNDAPFCDIMKGKIEKIIAQNH